MVFQIENQQEMIDEPRDDPEKAFIAVLYQMEIERVKYTLTRYLRTRLRKIEKSVLFIAQSDDMKRRLSPQELDFLKKYINAMASTILCVNCCFGKTAGLGVLLFEFNPHTLSHS